MGKHLRELFRINKPVSIDYAGDTFELLLVKPSVLQQEEAVKKARTRRARVLARYNKKDSDERMVISSEVNEMTREDLLDTLVSSDETELRRQAIQEILYNPDIGGDWGDEGEKYFELMDAGIARAEEITSLNEGLKEEDEELRITLFADKEFNDITEQQKVFDNEVDARYDELREERKKEVSSGKTDEMRKNLIADRIQSEADAEWYTEYRTNMLYWACRDREDQRVHYFENHNELLDLPATVIQQLLSLYETFEGEVEDLKALQSLGLSSDSSELPKE